MIKFAITDHLKRENSEVISVFRDGKFIATIISNADNENAIRIITNKDKGTISIENESTGPFIQFKIRFEEVPSVGANTSAKAAAGGHS